MPRGRSLGIAALMLALIAGCAVAFARTQALKQDRPLARAVKVSPTLEPGREPARLVLLVRAPATVDAEMVDDTDAVVRMLEDDLEIPAGRTRLEWDGADDGGRPVTPGDYRLRVRLGEPPRTITFQAPVQVQAARSER